MGFAPIVQEDGRVSRPVWMGVENIASLQGFESRTVQLVASRCINYAIPGAIYLLSKLPFVTKKIFFGFETRLVGIDVSETITLLCYKKRHDGDGKVFRNVLFLQPF
jgi:hypothetical protein